MATARSDYSTDIEQLQLIFGNISREDCELLLEEFDGENIDEITQNVYDTLESSRFTSVKDMIWHIKQDPSFGIQRSGSSEDQKSKKESWSLAKSKSSNTINKQLTQPPVVRMQPMPYSGTRNPVKILRSSRTIEPILIQPYLTKYMQDPQMRNLLYDIYECRYPKLLILMRGASGSGKSTLSSIIWAITEKGEICSADHYFTSRSGQYKFNRSSLGDAHESCRNHCRVALARGDSPVIIDNTNTKIDEMLIYVQMAVENNYEIKIAEPRTGWETKPGILVQKSLHGVPKRTIEDQLDRFEKTTEKSLVDRILKRMGGSSAISYRPNHDLEWGRDESAPMETWDFSRMTQPSELNAMMTSLSVSSPTRTRSLVQSPSPILQSTQISWTEPPSTGPPTSFLLSDLVPDLTLGTGGFGPKVKRAAKRNGASGGGTSQGVCKATQSVPFEDPAHLKFEKLRTVFPSVALDELERIFNLYEGDVDHCASALMEQGVEMSGIMEPALVNQTKCDSQDAELDDNTWDTHNNFKEPCKIGHYKEGMSSSTDEFEDNEDPTPPDSLSTDDDSFEMILPIEFARLLLCEYGHPDDEKRSISLDELTVKVPVDAAFEIYKSLYLNMHKTENEFGRSTSPDASTRSNSPTTGYMDDEFSVMAIGLSQMEMETNPEDPHQKLSTDRDINHCDLNPETLQLYSAQNRTMAQNINFCMLKQEYPFLDMEVIDEIYTQCFLNADKTRSWLNEMFPQSTQQSLESKTTSGENTWHLKYNPKDILLYSPEDLKKLQKNYDKLENEWLVQMAKMRDYYQKCQNMSNCQIKAHYVSEAKKISDVMKSLTEEMQYFKALNINAKHKNDQILDLHGLKINGAMRVLKEFLQCKVEEFINVGTPKMILLIITGKGNHSKNGCPVLQPAVRNFLTQRGYQFHAGKPGSYTVILTRNFIARTKQARK